MGRKWNRAERSQLGLPQIVLILAVLAVALGDLRAAMAQWVSNGPPGEVNAIAIDPRTPATIYLGTSNRGIFKSVNGGANWSASSKGLTPSDVTSLAIDPQTPTTIYAGTQGGGVFKSVNGGAS